MKSLTLFVSLSSICHVALATSAYTTSASTPVCSKTPYKDVSFLRYFQPALSFCSQYYPLPAQTTTITVSGNRRRSPGSYSTPSPSTTTCNYACSAFSSFQKTKPSYLSTLCSCIETQPTITVTKTTSTTKYPTTTTTKATSYSTTSTVPSTSSTATSTYQSSTTVAPTSTTYATTTSSSSSDSTVYTTTTVPSTVDTSSTQVSTTVTSTVSASPSTSCYRLGCFTDRRDDRALSPGYYAGQNSPSICQQQATGYTYFGLEYSSECFYGNSINPNSTIADDSNCNYSCNQDPNENDTCGGDNFIEIYECDSS